MTGSRFPAVAIGLFVLCGPASAATTIVWQGDLVVTAATPACSAGASERTKIDVGTVLKSVVRPGGTLNGGDDRISFVHDTQAMMALDLAAGLTAASGTYAAYGATPNGAAKTNVGGTYSNFALTPAAPTGTTSFLKFSGTVKNFMFITNCTVTFRGGYALRPD